MKKLSFFVFVIGSLLGFGSSAVASFTSAPPLWDPACAAPITKLGYEVEDLFNDFDGTDPKHLQPNDRKRNQDVVFTVNEEFRGRYLVGDFNTMETDADGNKFCRGVEETNPQLDLIDELADQNTFDHYMDSVGQFETEPMNKPPIVKYRGNRYCIGQRMVVCDAKQTENGVSLVKVAEFITSSRHGEGMVIKSSGVRVAALRNSGAYYAPINKIAQRAWDIPIQKNPEHQKTWKGRVYTEADMYRDEITGGSKGRFWNKYSEKKIPMPNFMYFVGIYGEPFMNFNGIHENTSAVGSELRDFLGAPVSVGCIRLHDFASKFVRWYIPRGARFFIHYDLDHYMTYAPEEKGKN